VAWLTDKITEPEWPKFPPEPARSQRRFHLAEGRPEPVEEVSPPKLYTDHQSAALWVGSASILFDVVKRLWLRDIIHAYSTWTYAANGSELEENDDVDHPPCEWNDVYFKLLASCLPGLTSQEADKIAIAHITSLPGESFCDAMTTFLRNVDAVYFNVDPKTFGTGQPRRKDIDNLLAALVRLGIPDAHRLEEALRLLQ
jgi:hypothetical protein